ncbi:MAG: undecaprenyldiphospho-muramoylpentapeptide beta-N-acetylglucosaminyltransferase, partial [Nitrospirales bacterium]
MTVVIAAGGTGGHVYPGIALAREFLRIDPQTPVLFVGTARGLEAKVVPHEGFELATIDAKPVMGGGPLKALRGLLALPAGIRQSVRLLKARQAGLVIGIGGYASPPVVLAAWLLGIPRVLVEPNAYPGVANRALGPLAQRVFLAFESAGARFSRAKVRVVGTPVRRSLMEGAGRRADSAAGRQVLVFGGSQGARAINEAMMAAAPFLKAKEPALVVRHQTGEADHTRVARAYREAGVQAEVVPYLYDMTEALGVADLVVCRAGATTVAELTASGKPAILIPLP